jgi:vacuolar-type H+-ATPase subunit I/STV1
MSKNKNTKSRADKLKEEFYRGMAELREGIKELRERQKKTDEQIKKTDEQINKLTKTVHSVSDGGRFVEGIVSPSAVKYFFEFGYKIKDVAMRRQILQDRIVIAEFDTFIESYYNGKKYFLIGEAKTHCTSEDVRDFIERIEKLRELKIYEDAVIIGFVAAISYARGVDKNIIKRGLYLFKITDDIMELQVPKDFVPKEF